MFGIKNIFEKPKAKLYYIEIDDDKIDKELAEVIIQVQSKTKEFQSHFNDSNSTFLTKDGWISDIRILLMGFTSKLETLKKDLKKIIDLEMKNKDYLIIKDDDFLMDKKNQLELMTSKLENFIDILDQKPSTSDLKTELLNLIIKEINSLNDSIQKIILDDTRLRFIYKKLMDL